MPSVPEALIPVAGDMAQTPGVWVRQILANPSLTHGKYANVAPEVLSFGEMLKIWSEVSGRRGVYVQASAKKFEEIWGVAGAELADQLVFGEVVSDWTVGLEMVGMEALGITKEDAPGFKATLEGFKAAGLL